MESTLVLEIVSIKFMASTLELGPGRANLTINFGEVRSSKVIGELSALTVGTLNGKYVGLYAPGEWGRDEGQVITPHPKKLISKNLIDFLEFF